MPTDLPSTPWHWQSIDTSLLSQHAVQGKDVTQGSARHVSSLLQPEPWRYASV